MSAQPRRLFTPGASRKRKEMDEDSRSHAPPPPPLSQSQSPPPSLPPTKTTALMSSNGLLAGYLANEFLTKGTLMGQRWELGRADAGTPGSGGGGEAPAMTNHAPPPQRYAEVARVVAGDGSHIPGIVNPTQLAGWIEMRGGRGAT